MLLRFEQDSSEGENTKRCARAIGRWPNAEPAQASLQYLRIRCVGDEQQKNAQFISAQQKWPDDPWLSLAAGATYAERGNYLRGAADVRAARSANVCPPCAAICRSTQRACVA